MLVSGGLVSKHSSRISRIKVILLLVLLYSSRSGFAHCETQTAFSLESATIEVPYIDLGTGSLAFEIELNVYDVNKLKEFHIEFGYDSNVVEYFGGEIDRSFYLQSRGGTGSALDKLLATAYTGSGTMYRYTFRVVGLGTTNITLKNPEFLDVEGNPIEFTTNACTVTVLPFNEFVDQKYLELEAEHLSLLNNYTSLESAYDGLSNDYNELDTEFNELETHYNTLITKQETLETDIEELEAQHNELVAQNNDLQTEVEQLKSENDDLESTVNQLQEEIESLKTKQIPGFPTESILIGMICFFILAYALRCPGSLSSVISRNGP